MKNRCNSCGLCCKLFYINLSRDEYESGKYQTIFKYIREVGNNSNAQEWGANLLDKNNDGECVYLIDNKCSIHDWRPKVCRDFFCSSKEQKFEEMRLLIQKEKNALLRG